jgi:hypothetical protein
MICISLILLGVKDEASEKICLTMNYHTFKLKNFSNATALTCSHDSVLAANRDNPNAYATAELKIRIRRRFYEHHLLGLASNLFYFLEDLTSRVQRAPSNHAVCPAKWLSYEAETENEVLRFLLRDYAAECTEQTTRVEGC